MRFRTAILFTAGLVVVQLFYALAAYSRVSAQECATVWDGIYTAEQAKRGEGHCIRRDACDVTART